MPRSRLLVTVSNIDYNRRNGDHVDGLERTQVSGFHDMWWYDIQHPHDNSDTATRKNLTAIDH